MVIYLNTNNYISPPFLFARTININISDPELFKLLTTINIHKLSTDLSFKNINEINEYLVNFYIINDKALDFFEYLKSIHMSLDKKLIDNIITYKPLSLIKMGITNDHFKEYLTYKILLCTEELDNFKICKNEFEIDIAINFLEEIIANGLLRSFYYLYKNDPSILYTKFDNGDNILHKIEDHGEYEDLTRLVLKLDKESELLNMTNDNNETPIVKKAKTHPSVVNILLRYEIDPTILDKNKNSFLHNLCINGSLDVIKLTINEHPELLNLQNENMETPVLLVTKYSREDLFYMLQGFKADLQIQDIYGNTPYHYICKNEICLGMAIENISNKFGFKPIDYCKISPEYYYFID